MELCAKEAMPAVSITDTRNLFGALEFSLECQKKGIQPIIGTSINLLDITHNNNLAQITFLVKNNTGYENSPTIGQKRWYKICWNS